MAMLLCAMVRLHAAQAVWVFLADKPAGHGLRTGWHDGPVAATREQLDQSLDPAYLHTVAATGVLLRQRSRWFNAVSVTATPEQVQNLRLLPFVLDVRPVRELSRLPDTEEPPGLQSSRRSVADLQYGESFLQNAVVAAHLLHARDVLGQGVRVAIIDAGFNWKDHRAFADLNVVAWRDFLNDDLDVGDEEDEPVSGNEIETGQNLHGTEVLGVLAGHDPGHLVGIAPRAEYLLAKTEDARFDDRGQELDPATEEDRWIAALEWADSLGAQVVNSSLGYITFDDGTGYTYDDLDGKTALTTRAAELAVARGIVVVAAAGNEGSTDWHYITVPADGAGVLAVGAVHPESSRLAFFSSRGPTADGRIKPDLVAPGQQIVTVSGRGADSTAVPFSLQEYRRLSGTSFSAPIVSGACALLLQLHPDWSPGDVADALRSTAVDLGPAGPDTLFGWGLIDVARASGLDAIIPERNLAAAPFPNPARAASPVVYFPVALHSDEDLSLAIFDAAGGLVHRVETRRLPRGDYINSALAPRWDVAEHVADGVYFYVLTGGTFRRTGKVAVLRTN